MPGQSARLPGAVATLAADTQDVAKRLACSGWLSTTVSGMGVPARRSAGSSHAIRVAQRRDQECCPPQAQQSTDRVVTGNASKATRSSSSPVEICRLVFGQSTATMPMVGLPNSPKISPILPLENECRRAPTAWLMSCWTTARQSCSRRTVQLAEACAQRPVWPGLRDHGRRYIAPIGVRRSPRTPRFRCHK